MTVTVLAFGIAKDIFGDLSIQIELPGADVSELKKVLEGQYPRLRQIKSYMIAVNNEYAADDLLLTKHDEIAVIPPVSGG